MRTVPAEVEAQYSRFLKGRGDAAVSLFNFLKGTCGRPSAAGAWAALVLSRIYIVKGRVGLALPYLDLSRRLFQRSGCGSVPVGLDINRAVALKMGGRRGEAADILRRALKDGIRCGDVIASAKSAVNLSMLTTDHGESKELLDHACTVYRSTDSETGIRRAALARLELKRRAGLHDEAFGLSLELEKSCAEPLLVREKVQALLAGADSLIELEEYSKASCWLDRLSLDESGISTLRPQKAALLYLRSKLSRRLGRTEDACNAFEEAERLRKMLGLDRLIFPAADKAPRLKRCAAGSPRQPHASAGRAGVKAGGLLFVTSCPLLISGLRRLEEASKIGLPVLVEGESGVGKEIVSRLVHFWSGRGKERFLPVNAAALPAGLFESILFGHARGAFTGAIADRPGLVELARGGTIFLDEIGDMPEAVQAKLLRFLETGEYMRLGYGSVRKSELGLVAATNADLEARVDEGSFRADLFYRLAAFRIRIPPLRERVDDIGLLSLHFLSEICRKHGIGPLSCSAELLRMIKSHPWPGNARELRNELLSAAAKRVEGVIRLTDMSQRFVNAVLGGSASNADGSLDARMKATIRDEIISALMAAEGNRTKASGILGIKRTTLIYRMKRLGIE